MDDHPSYEKLAAEKARQETNRAARLRQLYSPVELWKRQRADLDELAKLRSDLQRRRPRTTPVGKPRPASSGSA